MQVEFSTKYNIIYGLIGNAHPPDDNEQHIANVIMGGLYYAKKQT
jgi:hypothetical protein